MNMFTSSAKKAIVSALFVATTLSASSVALAQSQRMKLEIAPSDTVCFRLYNPWSAEHLFTSDRQELITLNRLGWRWEGVSWKDEGDTVVYRLYNPYVSGGDHHYTTSKQEVDECLAHGWKLDSSTKLSVSDIKRAGLVPVYRLYNPYEQEHYHHFTADKDEQQHLISLGWRDEGVAWWAKPVNLVRKGDVYRVEGSSSQGQTIELTTGTDTSHNTQAPNPNFRAFDEAGKPLYTNKDIKPSGATRWVVDKAAVTETQEYCIDKFAASGHEIRTLCRVNGKEVEGWQDAHDRKLNAWLDYTKKGKMKYLEAHPDLYKRWMYEQLHVFDHNKHKAFLEIPHPFQDGNWYEVVEDPIVKTVSPEEGHWE